MIACTVFIAGLLLPTPILALRAMSDYGGCESLILAVFGIPLCAGLVVLLWGLWAFHPFAWSAGHALFLFLGLISSGVAAVAGLDEGLSFTTLVAGAGSAYFLVTLLAYYGVRGDWQRRADWLRARSPLAGYSKGSLAAALRRRRGKT